MHASPPIFCSFTNAASQATCKRLLRKIENLVSTLLSSSKDAAVVGGKCSAHQEPQKALTQELLVHAHLLPFLLNAYAENRNRCKKPKVKPVLPKLYF